MTFFSSKNFTGEGFNLDKTRNAIGNHQFDLKLLRDFSIEGCHL